MTVWVLVTQYLPDGIVEASVHSTRQKSLRSLHAYVEENWDSEILGELIDTSDDEVIDRFYEEFGGDFSYSIVPTPFEGSKSEVVVKPEEIFIPEEDLKIASVGLQCVNIEDLAKEVEMSVGELEDKLTEIAKKLG